MEAALVPNETTLARGTRAARDFSLLLGAVLAPLAEGGFQVALLLALLFGGAHAWARRSRGDLGRVPWTPMMRLFVTTLCCWIAAGVVTALLRGHMPRTSALNYVLMSFAVMVGFGLGASAEPRRLGRLAWALAAGASVAALLGLWQVVWGDFPGESLLTSGRSWMGQLYVPGTRERAATGLLLNRLKMGEMWLLCIATAVAARVAASRPRGRILTVGAVLGGLVMLGLTYSKAALLGALVGIAAVVAMELWPWARRRLLPAVFVVVVAGFLAAALVGATHRARLPVPRGSMAVRPWLWSIGMHIAAEYPLAGAGLGTYRVVSPSHVPSGNQSHMYGAHNQCITVLAEGGLLGGLLWLLLLWAIGHILHRAWRREPADPARRALRAWATAVLVMLAPMSLVHDVLFHPGTALVFWLACGVSLALGRSPDDSEPPAAVGGEAESRPAV